MADEFDPRQAALNHAGDAASIAEQGPATTEGRNAQRVAGEFVNAIACGLVYVGDKIDGLRWQLEQDAVSRDQLDPASWREFLREQAVQIPAGVEASLRKVTEHLERVEHDGGYWTLGGTYLTEELGLELASLTDWLNQLKNVREAVGDGSAGE